MPPKEAKSMQDYIKNESAFSRAARAVRPDPGGLAGIAGKAVGKAAGMKMKMTKKTVKATPAQTKKEEAKKRALLKKARSRGGRYEQLR